MQNEEMVWLSLRTAGVDSVGIYVVKGVTHIALHCQQDSKRKDAKEFLQTFLKDEVIL